MVRGTRTLPDIMFLELGKDRGYLLARQPTEGSPDPPEEDDDAGLVPPQILEGGHLLGAGLGQLALGDGGRVHPCCLCNCIVTDINTQHSNCYEML